MVLVLTSPSDFPKIAEILTASDPDENVRTHECTQIFAVSVSGSFIHSPCFAQAKGLLDAAFLGLFLS